MECTPAFLLARLVGWRVMGHAASSLKNAVQRTVWWCGHGRGPRSDVFALPCWTGLVPTQHWRLQFWAKFWMLLVPILLWCRSMEVRMRLQRLCKLSGRWVPGKACWIPHIRSAAVEAMPPANSFVCLWEPWPVLPDWICCELVERGRNSRLDGFPSSVAQGHHNKRSVNARASQRGAEPCWGVALDCVLPQRNWPKRRTR